MTFRNTKQKTALEGEQQEHRHDFWTFFLWGFFLPQPTGRQHYSYYNNLDRFIGLFRQMNVNKLWWLLDSW